MKFEKDIDFAAIDGQNRSQVFQLYPSVFNDQRGLFCEVLRNGAGPEWVFSTDWIKQVNRSKSVEFTVRGCHAQYGTSCQGKLVQVAAGSVYDIITDARPDSPTFGKTKAYLLDEKTQNMLWVPRGFLHGFAVPRQTGLAVFEYMCDNVYDHSAEFSVCPTGLVEDASENDMFKEIFADGRTIFSEKDMNGEKRDVWMSKVRSEYFKTGKIWYR